LKKKTRASGGGKKARCWGGRDTQGRGLHEKLATKRKKGGIRKKKMGAITALNITLILSKGRRDKLQNSPPNIRVRKRREVEKGHTGKLGSDLAIKRYTGKLRGNRKRVIMGGGNYASIKEGGEK